MSIDAPAEQHGTPHWHSNQAQRDADHHTEAGAHGAEEARNGGIVVCRNGCVMAPLPPSSARQQIIVNKHTAWPTLTARQVMQGALAGMSGAAADAGSTSTVT